MTAAAAPGTIPGAAADDAGDVREESRPVSSAAVENREKRIPGTSAHAPCMVAPIASGVTVVLEFKEKGFLGRDICVCGREESEHRQNWRGDRYCRASGCSGFRGVTRPDDAPDPRPVRQPSAERPSFVDGPAPKCGSCSGTGRLRAPAFDAAAVGPPCPDCVEGRAIALDVSMRKTTGGPR